MKTMKSFFQEIMNLELPPSKFASSKDACKFLFCHVILGWRTFPTFASQKYGVGARLKCHPRGWNWAFVFWRGLCLILTIECRGWCLSAVVEAVPGTVIACLKGNSVHFLGLILNPGLWRWKGMSWLDFLQETGMRNITQFLLSNGILFYWKFIGRFSEECSMWQSLEFEVPILTLFGFLLSTLSLYFQNALLYISKYI